MAMNEDFYIEEWIDYHLKLGFDDIHIYQNNWRFGKKILIDNVYFHEWDGSTAINEKPLWERNIQAKCYSTFSKDYVNEYEWAAFFDVDEFLVLNKHKNVKDFIDNYKNNDCVIINWAMFGDNNLKDFDEKNTSSVHRFTKRKQTPHNQFKSISRLSSSFNHEIHMPYEHNKGIKKWIDTNFNEGFGPFNQITDFGLAMLNHYFCRTFFEFKLKSERGNACKSGVDGRRNLSDFYENNFNEVEDLTALNFYQNEKNNIY